MEAAGAELCRGTGRTLRRQSMAVSYLPELRVLFIMRVFTTSMGDDTIVMMKPDTIAALRRFSYAKRMVTAMSETTKNMQ
jgi:hypothetical protein